LRRPLRRASNPWPPRLALLLAVPLLTLALAGDVRAHWDSGLRPQETSYGAVVFTFFGLQALYVATLTIMALYTVARSLTGKLDAVRRVTFDNTMLLWHYAVAQGLIGLAIVGGFPRLAGA
jgi:cytochrome c oxidase subunit I+III